MFTPLQGFKLGRRAIVIGFALAGTTATAVGAASGHTPWREPPRPSLTTAADLSPTTDTPTTMETVPAEPKAETTVPPPPSTNAVVVTTTEIAPPQTPEAIEPEPAPGEPVATEAPIVTEAPVVEPAAEEPAATEPGAPIEPPTSPPPPSAAKPTNDNVVPATLSLACVAETSVGPVSCSWSGGAPDGFASFVLLRSDPDGKGRVPYRTRDAGANTFADGTASAGSHSYVLVALDAADHPLAHSNMVLVQIAAA